jgi:replicative DNA helicase
MSDLKTLPQSNEAEQSVLGALLIDAEAIAKIADFISPEDFYNPQHLEIFDAMRALYEKRIPIDIVSVTSKLEETGRLERAGGRTYLASLSEMVPTSAHIVHYAHIVQKKATLRRLISAATGIVELGYHEDDEVDILLDDAEQKLFGVSQKFLRQNFTSVSSLLTDAFERIDDLHREPGKTRGIPTGLIDLDDKLAGLQKSDLVIIAARPSMGKTSLALDMARHAAVYSKVPIGIFSLEMSKEQLVDRMLCSEANVDLWRLRTGKLSDDPNNDEFTRISEAMGRLSEAPIYIDDGSASNIMEMRTKARRLQADKGLGLLIVDYLQLMEGRGDTDNRVQMVSEITRGLKGIARELNIPVIALSQLSRAVESRPTPIPKLADLRESGSIEQDADVVLFIYREEMYKPNTDRKHISDIIIAKHRNGPTGRVELYFDGERSSFRNLDKKHA